MPLSAELERALAGLLNPLRFACENDFTALPRLGSIESMLCRNARHIRRLIATLVVLQLR